jgi:integrase
MARTKNKLTDLQVRRRKQPGWLSDGDGLYLRVSTERHGGGRRWVLRYTRDGRKREMGLGDADTVSLAEARDLRDKHQRLLRAGQDPLAAKRAAKREAQAALRTFGDAALSELKRRQGQWRKNGEERPSSAETWRKGLLVDCGPIADKPVEDITAADVVAVLKPYWDRGAMESADRLRVRVKAVLDHAIAMDWRTTANPATRERFEKIAPERPDDGQPHHAALKWEEMPAFIAKLKTVDAMSSLALQMMALTACRSNEVRGMRWTEVDWTAKTWTVPCDRMKPKAKRPHVVPLSGPALALLSKLNQHSVGALVFWGLTPNRAVSNMSCYKVVRRLAGRDATVHGVRASFRSWCDDHGVPHDVAEKALAHVGGVLDKAYRRTDMLEPRRPVMEAWAAFLGNSEAADKVVARDSKRKR